MNDIHLVVLSGVDSFRISFNLFVHLCSEKIRKVSIRDQINFLEKQDPFATGNTQ